jgi:cytochrome c oxidase subunit I+III
MPGLTYAPFTMAVGFLAIFAAALIEDRRLLGLGGVLVAVALVLWFRPQRSETLALEELGDRKDPGRLPLAIGGPQSNGWWGTLVFISILATALVSVVAGYFYLRDAPAGATELPFGFESALTVLLPLLALGTALWTMRATRTQSLGAIKVCLLSTWLLSAAALATGIAGFPWQQLDAATSAYASAVLAVLGFEWLVLMVVLGMSLIALLWAFGRPRDPRGYAVAENMTLVAAFSGISAVITYGVVYLTPMLW